MTDDNKYKILIVDDDQFLLDMYTTKFEHGGHTVETATSSEKALELLREGSNPDIVLLDIIMPTMDGVECLQLIRDENLLPESSVVIMLTNQKNEENIAKTKKLAIDGYIVKAAAIPSEVIDQIMEIAGRKRGQSGI